MNIISSISRIIRDEFPEDQQLQKCCKDFEAKHGQGVGIDNPEVEMQLNNLIFYFHKKLDERIIQYIKLKLNK